MNQIFGFMLRGLRRMLLPFHNNKPKSPALTYDKVGTKKAIRELLESDNPVMIARYGCSELNIVANYLGVKNSSRSVWKFITWKVFQWWWAPNWVETMRGSLYPMSEETLSQYAEVTLEDSGLVDLLGSWLYKEHYILPYLSPKCNFCKIEDLEPDYEATDASEEWTQALKGKNVLVVNIFAETIKKQYKNRRQLFGDPEMLPEFNLITLKVVYQGESRFVSWMDELQSIKDEMDKIDYDIAIIGCGVYGFNLAAHAKRTGHKAIHLGGATQLLFGIYGNRWIGKSFIKDSWCRPSSDERPANADEIEGACYW